MLLLYLISRRYNAAAEMYDAPDPRNNPDGESQRYAAIATNENTRQNNASNTATPYVNLPH